MSWNFKLISQLVDRQKADQQLFLKSDVIYQAKIT